MLKLSRSFHEKMSSGVEQIFSRVVDGYVQQRDLTDLGTYFIIGKDTCGWKKPVWDWESAENVVGQLGWLSARLNNLNDVI